MGKKNKQKKERQRERLVEEVRRMAPRPEDDELVERLVEAQGREEIRAAVNQWIESFGGFYATRNRREGHEVLPRLTHE